MNAPSVLCGMCYCVLHLQGHAHYASIASCCTIAAHHAYSIQEPGEVVYRQAFRPFQQIQCFERLLPCCYLLLGQATVLHSQHHLLLLGFPQVHQPTDALKPEHFAGVCCTLRPVVEWQFENRCLDHLLCRPLWRLGLVKDSA